jgi:hypothetical protein
MLSAAVAMETAGILSGYRYEFATATPRSPLFAALI